MTLTNTITNTQDEKKTNTTPVVKNMTNKNIKNNSKKVVHPRNPLSYPYVMHRLPTEW